MNQTEGNRDTREPIPGDGAKARLGDGLDRRGAFGG